MRSKLGNRLDKHFSVMSALVAAAAIGGVAQKSSATISYHAAANINIPSTFYGLYLNVQAGTTTNGPGGPAGWDLNPYGVTYLRFYFATGCGWVQDTDGVSIANLPNGALISAASTFATAIRAASTTSPQPFVLNSSNNLVGFKFVNEAAASQTQYGWARIQTGATLGGQPRTVLEYAYEDSGAGITAGATGAGTGACCMPNGSCTPNLAQAACTTAGGIQWVSGTACASANCPQPGACCNADGTCTPNVQAGACTTGGGVFNGAATCALANCQSGACCKAGGECVVRSSAGCLAQGGVYGGDASTCGAVTCNPQYFYDDGVAENGIGFNAASASIAWMSRYTVVNNRRLVSAIEIAFGSTGAGAVPATLVGLPVNVYLWSDPNADGSPADGVVIGTVAGTIGHSGNPNSTFDVFTLATPVDVGPNGTNFFAGAVFTLTLTSGTGVFPAGIDQTHTAGRSWISGNANNTPVDPNNLSASGTGVAVIDSFGLPGNWMVRVDASIPAGCYANCDNSTQPPVLNVGDFTCFLQKYAANDPYANCDASTQPPVLNVGDFTCFLQKYAAGCT